MTFAQLDDCYDLNSYSSTFGHTLVDRGGIRKSRHLLSSIRSFYHLFRDEFIMKYTLAAQQKSFFERNQFITFQNILSGERIEELSKQLYQLLNQRCRPQGEPLMDRTPPELMAAGDNLRASLPLLAKYCWNRSLARLAAELFDSQSLRIGYELFLPALSNCSAKPLWNEYNEQQSCCERLLSGTASLQQISSLTDVAGGWLLALPPFQRVEQEECTLASDSLWPEEPGSAVLITADYPIPFSELQQTACNYLLLCYGEGHSLYRPSRKDPFCHFLKTKGYVIGDRLRSSEHPLLYTR